MTRVDFYVLNNKDADAASMMACRLAEKAFTLKHHIYIHTADQTQSEKLDKLLWTFREGSFLPHQLFESGHSQNSPILIGHNAELDQDAESLHQVLINLGAQVPSFFSRFERVAEIVSTDDQAKEQARDRYKFYQQRGYELETHKLSN
ncbi:MAG: DNA polymerase III subunit chi [Gammaproteobacteria bacterium]|nr:DNA polymerase III subunit chi [Gammaproteobacteria bacterium]